MRDTVRWGIIGCGDVTEVKSGPALQLAVGSELVAVMRRTPGLAQDYARRHGVPRWYSDADALLADPGVDAVYVATPPDTHAEYTCRAAAAGKPVYVEKPMARTVAECDTMVAACARAGVPLYVAYYRRRLPGFVRIQELLAAGAIGQVRCVHLQLLQEPQQAEGELPWRVRPEIAGGGLLYDLAAHQLDLLDFLLGPVQAVHGTATNLAGLYAAEDTVSAHLRFGSGVTASGLWCFCAGAAARRDHLEIVGSSGRITCSTFGFTPVCLETASGVRHFDYPRPAHVQLGLIQTVVDALLGRGECPSTGVTGARTNWVLERLVADYYGRAAAPGGAEGRRAFA